MRRSASEIINNLENRIARLEKQSAKLDRNKLNDVCDKVEEELMKDIASRTEDMLEMYDLDNIWYDVSREFPEINGDVGSSIFGMLERALMTEISKEIANLRSKGFRTALEKAVKAWYEANTP